MRTPSRAKSEVADGVAAVRDAPGPDRPTWCSSRRPAGAIAEAIDHVKPLGTVVSLGFCTVPDTFVPVTA
ncbi:MAG: hypothetical protein IPJ52_05770 [Rhodocyclaceae bacterium]|nr:hypothetical protein [Rhodocyclaceae bacterium]